MENLFEILVEKSRLHPNFVSVMRASAGPERAELQRWADGFPDRDGKFRKEFQTTFNSSFWEIYLYALFRDYGFSFDWSANRPDFALSHNGKEFIVEATTANAAVGKPAEWAKPRSSKDYADISFNDMNRESIIRLASCFTAKWKHYQEHYSKLKHVKGKPFVLAIAPFEQPLFNLQYNRPITALLYDYYVDEDAYTKNPERYPDGPPGGALGSIVKDNGAAIELGFFKDDYVSEISAVIFSCTATWGKVDAMTPERPPSRTFNTVWGSEPNGAPQKRSAKGLDYSEMLCDGLQVYHNPFARNPLPGDLFRRPGVVQVFPNIKTNELIWEGESSCLMYRMTFNAVPRSSNSTSSTGPLT